eukprot:CAMPEP_0185596182 /NCGR_PEP_ID=MMETSP0434-20130131/80612_1 /TAXON_ID=626734 ORGANISM="Favella taraikaensis, Strain Fe Narragansett Bay" /NCGR_SAMPLE_ID=MMETSP0434 /ASSEMBLY_ACC=CAM_ASM_000379 /LENGTH=141 /DNA_ID=CAMNT_0028224649 /DNA_START=117 /DNA_END=542 /DNA_ORIENTATION=+
MTSRSRRGSTFNLLVRLCFREELDLIPLWEAPWEAAGRVVRTSSAAGQAASSWAVADRTSSATSRAAHISFAAGRVASSWAVADRTSSATSQAASSWAVASRAVHTSSAASRAARTSFAAVRAAHTWAGPTLQASPHPSHP